VLVISAEASHPKETCLIMRDRSVRYRLVVDPEVHLEKLLFYDWQGLSAPLPFLPNSSVAWCEKSDKGEEAAFDAVMKVWNDGYDGRPGEGSDPAVRRCFGAEPPLGELFSSIAADLIRPMLEHGGAA
jgi:exodeoxyribonuclease V gamma subunit